MGENNMSINLINYALAKKDWKKAYEDLKVLEIGGRNLLRWFYLWKLDSQMTIESSYRVVMNATASFQDKKVYELEVLPNTSYTLRIKSNGWVSIREVDVSGNELLRTDSHEESGRFNNGHTFITKNETVKLHIWLGSHRLGAGKYYFEYPKLEKGNRASDWTPAPEDINAHPFVAELAETVYRSKQNEERIKNLENAITALGGGS